MSSSALRCCVRWAISTHGAWLQEEPLILGLEMLHPATRLFQELQIDIGPDFCVEDILRREVESVLLRSPPTFPQPARSAPVEDRTSESQAAELFTVILQAGETCQPSQATASAELLQDSAESRPSSTVAGRKRARNGGTWASLPYCPTLRSLIDIRAGRVYWARLGVQFHVTCILRPRLW
jgi:hypothetical protein